VISVVYLSFGDAIAIMVGRQLGANRFEEAKDTAYKLIAFAVFSCVVTGVLLGVLGPIFPKLYDTTEEIRNMACGMIWINAFCMPLFGSLHACYFTLRSGGKTGITFLFDSVYSWVLVIPYAYVLANYTSLSIVMVFFLVQFMEIVKAIIGFFMVRSGVWLQNIVNE
jgi:Na+-driven multidrug efflux pump